VNFHARLHRSRSGFSLGLKHSRDKLEACKF
jgi:hypothetical protein